MRDLALMLPFALLVGCKDKSDTGGAEEDPGEHACEHVSEAGTAVTAGATAEEAPPISISEEPYTVTLAGGAGFVAFTVAAETDALLFLGTADVLSGISIPAEGGTLTAGEPAPNEHCPDEIPEHYDLHLEPGSYAIELGPSAAESLWLMLMPAEGHAHE